jgi:hypothetical protein
VNIARDRNEPCDAAAPAFDHGLGLAIESNAIDIGAAGPAHPLQPVEQSALGEIARCVQLTRYVAQRRLDVAPDHAPVVTRETQ